MKKKTGIELPEMLGAAKRKVLLHSCCAPCSSAILEFFLQNAILPTVFYSNSNIWPQEEYGHRRDEIKKYLEVLGIPFVEDKYNHEEWLACVKGLENQPERGSRCLQCFKFRMQRAAIFARDNGFLLFTTTLASSRWKNLEQINEAGRWAVVNTGSVAEQQLLFWDQNWRKGGLQERRNILLKECGFYNQQYCGCEFSQRTSQADCSDDQS